MGSPSIPPAPACCQRSRADRPLALQTYGSKNLLRVGVILQRATLILLLCCFPCCAILINIEQLLLLIRQDPEVSRSGGPVAVAQTPLPPPSLAPWGWGDGGHGPSLTVPLVSRRLTQRYVMAFVPALPVSPCGHPACWPRKGLAILLLFSTTAAQPLLRTGLVSSTNFLFRRFFCITWRQDTYRIRWVLQPSHPRRVSPGLGPPSPTCPGFLCSLFPVTRQR